MLLGARQFFERRGAPTPPLPYDAEVEYLESTGTQWIDTGISMEFPMACDMTFSIDTNYGTTTSIPVFGIRVSTNAKYAFWVSKTDGKLALNYGRYDSGFAGGDVRSFANVYNVGAKMYCNDALICDGGSPILENDSRTLYMFTLNDFGSASIRGSRFKIARATISNGSGDQVDFIPVRVGSGASAVGYMYDRISGMLFGNSGTGAFIIGPDKS